MSRHRDIRNLNIDEELDDDALSDGGEEPMTQEEENELYDALERVRAVIGSFQNSGISDKELKDCLWHEYYDVNKVVDWALGEQERRRAAQERKENDDSALEYWRSRNPGMSEDFSRVPKIVLAQQQAEQNAAYEHGYLSIEDAEESEDQELGAPRPYWTELSTITERTELITEPSPAWHSQSLPRPSFRGRGGADSSRTTSYGEELQDDSQTQRFFANIMDQETPRQKPTSLPPDDSQGSSTIPSIRMSSATPTLASDPSSKGVPPPEKPLPDRPQSIVSKKSKLASLASSRMSMAASSLSASSRDDGTALSGSIKTFPALRPSAHSDLAPSTAPPSLPSKDYPHSSASSVASQGSVSQGTRASDMSAQVRKAIQAALQLEALDKDVAPPPEKPKLTLAQPQSPPPAKGVPLQSAQSMRSPVLQSPKLAPLVRQPSSEVNKSSSPGPKGASSPVTLKSPIPSSPAANEPKDAASPGRPLSKLAMLAQQKVSANKAPKLPAPKTEYLTPTANGGTATTAITTSYQSLFSLTHPQRAPFVPKLDVAPLPPVQPVQPKKSSKLANKVKKASEKSPVKTPVAEPEDITTATLSPIFQNTSRSRASPSAFASVLVRDDLVLFKSSRKSKDSSMRHSRETEPRTPTRSRSSRALVSSLTPPSAFAFDSPSPDEIVFNARRGTSLAQSKNTKSATTSTLSSRS